jgi:hypothetical protein
VAFARLPRPPGSNKLASFELLDKLRLVRCWVEVKRFFAELKGIWREKCHFVFKDYFAAQF